MCVIYIHAIHEDLHVFICMYVRYCVKINIYRHVCVCVFCIHMCVIHIHPNTTVLWFCQYSHESAEWSFVLLGQLSSGLV